MRNLRMFKLLCGEDSIRRTILATTFWNPVPTEEAVRREKELTQRADLWGSLVEKGSRVFRVDSAPEMIIEYLVERREDVVLQIQRELVDLGKTLDETAAGHELQAGIGREKQKIRDEEQGLDMELSEARAKADLGWQTEIEAIRKDMERHLRRMDLEEQQLRIDVHQLRREEEKKAAARRRWQKAEEQEYE